jgi:hypothetical protein
MEWGLLVFLWLAVGWLPSRIMKHHFISEYGDVLGGDAWGPWMGVATGALAVGGPFAALGTLLVRATFGGKWGWRW